MKLIKLTLTLFLLGSFHIFTVAQTSDINEGCFPLTVNFTAPGGSSTFFWDFDDGAFSSEQNPSRIFTGAGTYNVSFAESSGGPTVGTVTINVYTKPEIMIGANPQSGCVPLDVAFTDNTTTDPNITINNWLWTFGDGSSDNVSAPDYTYTSTGSFTVSLEIETNLPSCNAIEGFTDFITVDQAPNVSFTTNPSPASACVAPLTVTFTNTTVGAGLTYMWDFGNGQTSTDQNPPAQSYTTDGNFPVTLTATNANNCSSTFTSQVSIGSPTADFDLPATLCLGATVTAMNTSSAGNYLWNFGPGVTPSVSTLANPVVQFGTAGPQTVSLTVTSANGQCMDDITRTIMVETADATFSADPVWSCSEPLTVTFSPDNTDGATYSWDFGDGQTSSEVSPTHEFFDQTVNPFSINGEMIFMTTLTIETAAGCSSTFTLNDTLNLPNALFKPDVVDGCAPVTVTFMDESTGPAPYVSFEYIYGDGNSNTFPDNSDHTYVFATPGEYDVILVATNSLGCRDTSIIQTIEVGEPITPSFSVDETDLCPGDTIHFTDLTNNPNIDAWHFSTDGNRTFHCTDQNELFYAFDNETGTFDVTYFVEYNGCLDSTVMTDMITVAGPIAEIGYMVNCETPFDIMFADSSHDASSVMWSFGDSTSSMLDDLIHSYDEVGDYEVVLMAENPGSGCPASFDTTTVHVRAITSEFELDTLLCLGLPYDLNGSPSEDVEADCWRGYTWDFSEGRPITTQEEVTEYFFGTPGRQKVFLRTRDINGCRDTSELTVTVYQNTPEFSFSDDTICFPTQVDFTDLSTADTTIVSWMWDFGDGQMDDNQNTSNTFTMGGNPITVTLSIEDVLGCPGSTTEELVVYTPISSISTIPFPAQICAGDSISFGASDFTAQGSNLTYSWDFGNGQTGTNQSETITYPSGGNYDVTLDFVEVASGCTGTTNATVQVQDYPIADFTTNVDGEPLICFPENIEFTDNSTTSSPLLYNWDFDTGVTSMNPGATIFYDEKGTYTVTQIVSTTFGCADTTSRTFTLVGPEGDYTVDTDIICKGETITFTLVDTVDIGSWEWDFGDGVIIPNVSPIAHQYDSIFAGGNIPAVLKLVGENGVCETAIPIDISINEVVADFSVDNSSTCVGEVPFDNNSLNADVFTWGFGDGNSSTAIDPSNIYTAAGMYTVTLAVENTALGCTDETSQVVTIVEGPDIEAEGENICFGEAPTLTANSNNTNGTFTWSPANLFSNNMGQEPVTVPFQSTVNVVVTQVDEFGCNGTDTVLVNVVPPLDLMPDTSSICASEPVTLQISKPDEYSFVWSSQQDPNLTSLSCQDCANPVVVTATDVTYQVRISDVFGLNRCSPTSADFAVDVIEGAFEYPKAFTPDGDGLNDYFNYVLVGDSEAINTQVTKLKIYNRWGNLVYDNDDPSQGWSGMDGSQPAPADVYLWIMEVNIEGCVADSEKGQVTLIR